MEYTDNDAKDAENLKEFRTRYPVRFTHDEYGNPIQSTVKLEAAFYEDAAEDELVTNDFDE